MHINFFSKLDSLSPLAIKSKKVYAKLKFYFYKNNIYMQIFKYIYADIQTEIYDCLLKTFTFF